MSPTIDSNAPLPSRSAWSKSGAPPCAGGRREIVVRPAPSAAAIPARERSCANTHVVGLPTPCTATVDSQCESLPPVAPTCAPRASQHSQ